jgi:hypothetical protein
MNFDLTARGILHRYVGYLEAAFPTNGFSTCSDEHNSWVARVLVTGHARAVVFEPCVIQRRFDFHAWLSEDQNTHLLLLAINSFVGYGGQLVSFPFGIGVSLSVHVGENVTRNPFGDISIYNDRVGEGMGLLGIEGASSSQMSLNLKKARK